MCVGKEHEACTYSDHQFRLEKEIREQPPESLTEDQQEIQHMMTCRNNDCRRCGVG